jgi:uroporphyrinogen decarboxylase
VRVALRGEAPDRPPYSFWTHLPGIDLEPQRLARESASFCERYDLDFLKSMPNGLYCVEDWGCVCDYSDIARGGVAKVVEPAVIAIEDWSSLERVDVTRGSFGRELEHLRLLVRLVGPGVPVLATVFSPLTIAGKLSNGASRVHLERDPAHVQRGLETITEVTCALTRRALEAGCAGIFFALQEATHSAYDAAAYRRYGEPYDRRVLAEARSHGGWFNAVHIHGEDILFDVIKDYDAAALNWHIGETAPSIEEYRRAGGTKPILGGLQRSHITQRDQAGIAGDIARTMAQTAGRGVLIAPACVIRHPVDDATLCWTAELCRRSSAPTQSR